MKFHYEFDIPALQSPIGHRDHTLMIGSCFTENMGEKLSKHLFRVLENPNGVLFNPVSVAEALHQYIEAPTFTAADLFYFNEAWHSWKHHSRFSGTNPDDALAKINEATTAAHQFLKKASHLFITLGSAWVYQLTEHADGYAPNFVAANNHKAPANWFAKKLLTPTDITDLYKPLIKKLHQINPSLQIIYTISPVRHVREGMVENNRSKAALIQAVHSLVATDKNSYYFPAYEIVIDDLRDYRFYAEDMVHPNYHATEYVWEKFLQACTAPETKNLIREIAIINLAVTHKPFFVHSEQHQLFLQKTYQKIEALRAQWPYLDFSNQIELLEVQLLS
jgi:hypothetical protein